MGEKAEPTPGPWKIDWFDGEPQRIEGGNGEVVCLFWGKDEQNFPNSIANAPMLASSRDMYEALKWARNLLRPNDDSDLAQTMDAAIAKAEGKGND